MPIRKIIIAPDPVLDTPTKAVEKFDDSIRELIADMLETMYSADGAGLAANQIGVSKRVMVLDLSSYIPEETQHRVIINPEITYFSEEKWVAEEGCLSFPKIKRIPIERPENIKVKYSNEHGIEQEIAAAGWLARAIQHELDHLNGITMMHYVSKIKKDLVLKKLKKYKSHNEAS
jgi:peptide deformylase